jgi:8-oxo-dGTP diphosphatase
MKKTETTLLTITILHNSETNEILLINRPEELGFPGFIGPGGKIELTESFSEGAAREVKEETGLTVKPEDLIYKGVDEFVIPGENYRYIVFHYITNTYEGNLLANPREGKPTWVSLNKLDEIQMQDWFRRRIPHFFQEGTFEISTQYNGVDRNPTSQSIRQLAKEGTS